MISQWIKNNNMKALVPIKNEINSLHYYHGVVDQGTQTVEIEPDKNVYFDPKLHIVKKQCPHCPDSFTHLKKHLSQKHKPNI